MKLILISDTHQRHKHLRMPKGDVLVHAGDFCSHGDLGEVTSFGEWLKGLDYKHIVFISGNHERAFERNKAKALSSIPTTTNHGGKIHYLHDSSVEIWGIKFYGSPWQPKFYNWAFNLPRDGIQLRRKWEKIPDDTDVLVTHGPPHGILDKAPHAPDGMGCKMLFKRVLDVKPKLHVFGHCHPGYGMNYNLLDGTIFVNASVVNNWHYIEHAPVEFEEDFDGKESRPRGTRKAKKTPSGQGSGTSGCGFLGEGI